MRDPAPGTLIAGDWRAKHPLQMSEPSRRFRHAVSACMYEAGWLYTVPWSGSFVDLDYLTYTFSFVFPPEHQGDLRWILSAVKAFRLAEPCAAPLSVLVFANGGGAPGTPLSTYCDIVEAGWSPKRVAA